MIEAEFHAVWITPKNKMRDVTPKIDGFKKILFLPDSIRSYEGKQVDNIRIPLNNDPDIQRYINIFERKFVIENRGERANAQSIIVTDEERRELTSLMAEATNLLEPLNIKYTPNYDNK
jgi:hypothetical protein